MSIVLTFEFEPNDVVYVITANGIKQCTVIGLFASVDHWKTSQTYTVIDNCTKDTFSSTESLMFNDLQEATDAYRDKILDGC